MCVSLIVFLIFILCMARSHTPSPSGWEYVLSPEAQCLARESLFVVKNRADEACGVGFFVSSNLAVTADHVLSSVVGSDEKPRSTHSGVPCLVDVCFASTGEEFVVNGKLEVVVRDDKLDVAVLTSAGMSGTSFGGLGRVLIMNLIHESVNPEYLSSLILVLRSKTSIIISTTMSNLSSSGT